MNHAYCRFAWAEADGPGPSRRPFALPGAKPRYAPDRPARVDHIALTVSFDFDAKILFGKCATTFAAVGKTLDAVELDGRVEALGDGINDAFAHDGLSVMCYVRRRQEEADRADQGKSSQPSQPELLPPTLVRGPCRYVFFRVVHVLPLLLRCG